MKRGRRSKYVVLLISLVLIFSLTGCKASKKKVLESSYYKELQKENIPFTEKQTEELSTVYEMLCEYNKKVNFLLYKKGTITISFYALYVMIPYHLSSTWHNL